MSTLPIITLFLFNMIFAFIIKGLISDTSKGKYISSKWVRLILLMPPVSMVVSLCVLVFGILYTIYMGLDLYLSND